MQVWVFAMRPYRMRQVKLNTDVKNCGKCGKVCPAQATCVGGTCKENYCKGLTSCSGKCVNKLDDVTNCGSCGTVCPTVPNTERLCLNGTCSVKCLSASNTFCDGSCVNTDTDTENCGGCGNGCPSEPNATPACVAGSCTVNFNSGFSNCDGTCVNTDTDAQNCGGSRFGCATQANEPVCCGGECVDTVADTQTCGRCGNVCPPGSPPDVAFCLNSIELIHWSRGVLPRFDTGTAQP